MADLLVEYADVVRLGIFAHTHMDEMRLLSPEGSQPTGASEERVAIKIIPSISPVDGNNPSFTVARVNPSSAALDDYEVIAANNQTGINAHWTVEYDYARSYQEARFSSSAVKELIGEFRADREAKTEASKVYLRGYFVGDRSMVLSPFWAHYVCALDNYSARKYAECVCSAVKE
jgi:sphingomyelin phosphodiesterase acid-like 3